jgi:hypothetical protein
MPRYQLETAFAHDFVAVFSAVCFFLNRPREGKIQLPVYGDPSEDIHLLDGYPLEETKFWAHVVLISPAPSVVAI